MKKGIFTYILRLTLTLLLITAVAAAALAGVNALTEDRIDAINKEKTQEAIRTVLPDVETFDELVPDGTWDSKILAIYCGEIAKTGEACYAVEVTPVGFGGEITMMVGIDPAGAVLGISIVSHSETVGVGAVAAASNVKGTSFRSQFVGADQEVAVIKDGGAIDALSGATVTSRAVAEGVNIALTWIKTHR